MGRRDEASLTGVENEVTHISDTKLGAERQVMWPECKQMEICCKLCENKAKSELIGVLSESVEEAGGRKVEDHEVELEASPSDNETIIPDNTQAQIPLGRLRRS